MSPGADLTDEPGGPGDGTGVQPGDTDLYGMVERGTSGAIEVLAGQVDQWINAHGVRYFSPLTNMAILSEEVGEVARIMARRFGEQSEKPSDRSKDLGEELADVVFVVLCLANQTGTDLQAAFDRKMAARTKRDSTRHRRNPKLRGTRKAT